MSHSIQYATTHDLPAIYCLFEEAIQFQKDNNYIGWASYDKAYIQADIRNGLLMKIMDDSEIFCIFSICYKDEHIWREKENGDALYIHRIVVNRKLRKPQAFSFVLDWAMAHARQHQLKYIRMDTWADNAKIIGYYQKFGFRFVENYTTPDIDQLPVQHRHLHLALLERSV
jgi:ribosomal protein S18 acetylase RimI-like enzyme